MINYKEVNTTRREITSITCDVCGKTYDDDLSLQEFKHIGGTGGYNSYFGDGLHYECELCEKCLIEILGQYMRTEMVA
jgi:hypothetical protein